MITKVEMQGRLASIYKLATRSITVDGENIESLLPKCEETSDVVEIEDVVIQTEEGDYAPYFGNWDIGERALVENIKSANDEHEADPRNKPFYRYHYVRKDWGQVKITVEFLHG